MMPERGETELRPGWSALLDVMVFRIVPGYKGDNDYRLEVQRPDGAWQPVHMRTVAVLVQFFFENEERLYPPPRYLGGEKFMRFLDDAVELGANKAVEKLQDEKRRKREREQANVGR
jgi:hypothetical protein